MKIQEIELVQVDIPPIPAIAKYMPKIFDLTLCRVITDEGLIGLGEAHGFPPDFEEAKQRLIGSDPLSIDPFTEEDPFECALLDIAGQAAGLPLHRFFGKQVRDRVPVSYWSRPMEPEETAAEAEVGRHAVKSSTRILRSIEVAVAQKQNKRGQLAGDLEVDEHARNEVQLSFSCISCFFCFFWFLAHLLTVLSN